MHFFSLSTTFFLFALSIGTFFSLVSHCVMLKLYSFNPLADRNHKVAYVKVFLYFKYEKGKLAYLNISYFSKNIFFPHKSFKFPLTYKCLFRLLFPV